MSVTAIPANPAGWVGPWEPPALTGLPEAVRYFDGRTRVVPAAGDDAPTYPVHVVAQGVQYPDGRVDQTRIRVDGVCGDVPLTIAQARKLAAAVLEAADEAAGWPKIGDRHAAGDVVDLDSRRTTEKK
jgi:hypothetical protein